MRRLVSEPDATGGETGRAIVIEPWLKAASGRARARARRGRPAHAGGAARGSRGPRARHRSQRGAGRAGHALRHPPGHLHRQGQGRRDRRPGEKPRSLGRGDGLPGLAGAAAQSGEGLERQGHRPHRADPGDLRPPRAHARRRAAGRARASHLPEEPAGALLDPSRAPARRLRLPRRPGRNADRRPTAASSRSASRASRASSTRSSAPASCIATAASACRTRSWRWSATPMPASRRCSTA